jgi:hypothetical protein
MKLRLGTLDKMLQFCTTRLYWTLIPQYRSLFQRWFENNDPLSLVTLEWVVEVLTMTELLKDTFYEDEAWKFKHVIGNSNVQEGLVRFAMMLGRIEGYFTLTNAHALRNEYCALYNKQLPISTVRIISGRRQYTVTDPHLTLWVVHDLVTMGGSRDLAPNTFKIVDNILYI